MYIYIYICIYIYVYIYIHIYICIYICMYICTYIYIYIYMFTYVHVYICTCIYIHMYTYVCVHVYVALSTSLFLPTTPFCVHPPLCLSVSECVYISTQHTFLFFANHAFSCAFSCLSVSEWVCILIYTTHLPVCSFRVRLMFSEHVYISTQHAFRRDASVSVCQSLGVYISTPHNSLCVPSVSIWYSVGVFTYPLNSPSSMILWCLYISQLVCLHIHTPHLPVCSFRVRLIFSEYMLLYMFVKICYISTLSGARLWCLSVSEWVCLRIYTPHLPECSFGVCLSSSGCVYISTYICARLKHLVLSECIRI